MTLYNYVKWQILKETADPPEIPRRWRDNVVEFATSVARRCWQMELIEEVDGKIGVTKKGRRALARLQHMAEEEY